MSGRKAIDASDPRYGPTCACGERKHKASKTCAACYAATLGYGVNTLGREESIITFRHVPTGAVKTLHCQASGSKPQIALGLRRLTSEEMPADEWEVLSRSTPLTILQDLKGRRDSRGEWRG